MFKTEIQIFLKQISKYKFIKYVLKMFHFSFKVKI